MSQTKSVLCVLLILLLLLSCGKNSGTVSQGNGPASGEYLFVGNSTASLNLSTVDIATGIPSVPTPVGSQANDYAIYPGVAATPDHKFLYALFTSFTVIQGFKISGPGFALSPLKNAPFFPSNAGPFNSMVMHPTGKFVYVIESPATIEVFSVTGSGNLTHASAVTEPADLRVAAIDPAGRFLFAVDLTGGRIFAYAINQGDGSLAKAPGSPFLISANSEPSIDVVDSSGKYLYVSQMTGGVAAFAINTSTGALSIIPGSPFPTTVAPIYIAADPAGKFVYTCDNDGSIDGFSINQTNGALTPVPGSPFASAPGTGNIAVDPSGKFVYVSIETGNSLYGYSIDSSTGILSALTGSPFTTIANPSNLYIAKVQ